MRKCIGFPSPVFSMAIAGVVYGCVSETKRAVAYVRLHFATAPFLSIGFQFPLTVYITSIVIDYEQDADKRP